MRTSAARLIAAIVVAATGIYLGGSLAVYSEKDDAPGGVLIAMVIILGSLVLATWVALRQPRKPSPNGG